MSRGERKSWHGPPGAGWTRAACLIAATFIATAAFAQTPAETPPVPIPHPDRVPYEPAVVTEAEPDDGDSGGAGGPSAIDPVERVEIPTVDENGNPLPPQDFTLVAVLTEGGTPIPAGVNWRIFTEEGANPATLVQDAEGGTMQFQLLPGRYFLHALYGWAGATAELVVTPENTTQTVVLNAGGLRLQAMVGENDTIPANLLRFEVRADDPALGDVVIIPEARPDQILRLSAGRYHIVSYYGDTNAIVAADIDVEAGQLTDLTLYHEAAQVTLKLVTQRGGEALANTAWTVLTPGGDLLYESVGAFPTLVLAAGEYAAIARHNDLLYEATFTVETGLDRDIEVLAENPIIPGAPAAGSAADAPAAP